MAKSYYSTVFEQLRRRGLAGDPRLQQLSGLGRRRGQEPDRGRQAGGDSVGAIRNVLYNGSHRRQQLLALSDVERSQTYCFAGVSPLPVEDFQATIRVTPIVDGDRAFVEWCATFDCDGRDQRTSASSFFRDAFAGWLGSLRRHLQRQARTA